ncbi:MAG: NAD-dependent protein deacetylase [Deltaproteobacteria bacterium]|nr:NAD-dependent protein deacetylase [Deltaproteobacteria bacterium]
MDVETGALAPLTGVLRGRRVVVLAGAGCSTDSGIPDYRGPTARPRKPMQHREFVGSEAARQRYWARATVGWPRMVQAAPNRVHRALAALEAGGAIEGVITQNVDGLHHAAGSRRVVELHGALARVRCLGCGARIDRAALHDWLIADNPAMVEALARRRGQGGFDGAPDGDAELPAALIEGFKVAACDCGGPYKPDVVFFGDNVPRAVVDDAWALFDRGEALLVVGSSLTVWSGYRFVRKAAERGVPVAIVNLGPTRGDGEAAVKIDAPLAEVLPALVLALTAR